MTATRDVAGDGEAEGAAPRGVARAPSEEMVRALVDSSDMLLRLDRDGRILYLNDAAVRLTGVSSDRWFPSTFEDLGFPIEECMALRAHVRRVVDEGVSHRFETIYDLPDERRYFEANLVPVLDRQGRVESVVADGRDTTTRHRTEVELAERATHDSLTGLANREVLVAEIDRALAASRRSDRCVGVLAVDLDRFKNVNDTLGHQVGDRVLRAAADRFTSTVRAGDLVARVGGDEFVVVARDLERIDDVMVQAHRIVEAFRSPLHVDDCVARVGASVGVATSSADSTSDDLLRSADAALYSAKAAGRDRAVRFSDDMRLAMSQRQQVEHDLRPAIDHGQFAVWYQPQVDLNSGEVVAVEALLRWRHPSGVVLDADRFIDVAEDGGLLGTIGDWVLVEACTQAAAWNATAGARQLDVGVNMSARQLARPGLHVKIAEVLQSSGLDPARLCVEVTETTMLGHTAESRLNLARLKDAGIRLAIDDFATGYGALACLRQVQIDVIKIDRTVWLDIAENDHDRRLVEGIVALATRLGMDVVAEGVETVEQATALCSLGCTTAQGFLYSPAVPAEDFAALGHL